MTPARLVATLGGVGLLRPAPGTWGSAVVLPLAWLGPLPCLVLALLLALAGIWAIATVAREGSASAVHDPGWVVVDEGAGMLLALAALPAGFAWPWALGAFLLFRLFDIVKWGPVGWADRRQGPAWVMLDDILAGTMAAGVLLIARVGGLG